MYFIRASVYLLQVFHTDLMASECSLKTRTPELYLFRKIPLGREASFACEWEVVRGAGCQRRLGEWILGRDQDLSALSHWQKQGGWAAGVALRSSKHRGLGVGERGADGGGW